MINETDRNDVASGTNVRCGQCGSEHLTKSTQNDVFTYGNGPGAIELSVPVPVFSCRECSFSFTTDAAESLRHEAVCRHLGVLTPSEVREIRSRVHFTRERFAALTGLGTASLARWETGELIQSAAHDKYLRLLAFADNLERLHRRRVDSGLGLGSVAHIEEHREKLAFKTLVAVGRYDECSVAATTFSLSCAVPAR
jgi:putative zinc finger/helix-turn-helix YgiT family protein